MSAISEFIEIIDNIFGVYFDAIYGFHLGATEVQHQQEEALRGVEGNLDKARYELDSKQLNYAMENSSDIVHSVTIREYKIRNWPGGLNDRWAAQMTLVTIFGFWEHKYREDIAKQLGKTKDELQINEIGDLRHYRHAIVHNRGRGNKDFKSLKVFTWFKEGEEIRLNTQRVYEMTEAIKAAILRLEST